MALHRSLALLLTFLAGMVPASLIAQNPSASDPNSTSANPNQNQELVDPGVIYNDTNPGSWVGKSITLKNVMVQDTNDTGNFWVGSDNHHRLLIVRNENNANLKVMRLHKGDVVTINGTIQPASKYEAHKTGEEKGSMHDAEKSSSVFLMADDISVDSSTHR
jgi:hypothetical protein